MCSLATKYDHHSPELQKIAASKHVAGNLFLYQMLAAPCPIFWLAQALPDSRQHTAQPGQSLQVQRGGKAKGQSSSGSSSHP